MRCAGWRCGATPVQALPSVDEVTASNAASSERHSSAEFSASFMLDE